MLCIEDSEVRNLYTSNEKLDFLRDLHSIFLESAKEEGVYEGYYYIGLMYLKGILFEREDYKAYYYFCLSAAHSHALSYYQLYLLTKRNALDLYSKEEEEIRIEAMFDYLKKAAEEGYVEAQYDLGNAYIVGEICAKDYNKALAWHRQACKNGYILSYEACGDLYANGGKNLNQNKILALVMYYTAYTKGNLEIKNKLLKLKDELVKEKENLPDMLLI